MANISPLLQQQMETRNQAHDIMYEKMKAQEPVVRPNAPKAHMVRQNPIQSAAYAVSDNIHDVANFRKAVKTGKISDNNLGRLNDLGLKLGAALIATFLALHSKTKQESIMRFVGGGAFIASMSLWPKLFIYLPSKIIHKVDPGEKYVSAQGDKKEFWIDNQYLLWDLKGISDEKEQRRQQKTALQNRTLNMATAGFGVPLMTAFICNRLEEPIKKAIVKDGVKKAQDVFDTSDSLEKYLEGTKPVVKHKKDISDLFGQYEGKEYDSEFFKKLSGYLRIDDIEFKDSDGKEVIRAFGPVNASDLLQKVWIEEARLADDEESLKKVLSEFEYTDILGAPAKLSEEEIEEITGALKERVSAIKDKDTLDFLASNLGSDKIKELSNNMLAQLGDAEAKNVLETITSNLSEDEAKELSKALFAQSQTLEELQKTIKDADASKAKELLGNFSSHFNNSRLNETFKMLYGKVSPETSKQIAEGAISGLSADRKEALNSILSEVKLSMKDAEAILSEQLGDIAGISVDTDKFKEIVSKLKIDKTHFEKVIQSCNEEIVSTARGREAGYLKHVNAIIGQTSESYATSLHDEYLKNLFQSFKRTGQEKGQKAISLKDMKNKDSAACLEMLSEYFRGRTKGVTFGSEEYEALVKEFTPVEMKDDIKELIEKLSQKENLAKIEQGTKTAQGTLHKAIFGEGFGNIGNIISRYIEDQIINADSTFSMGGIAVNYETRKQQGLIKVNGQDIRENPAYLKLADKLIYTRSTEKIDCQLTEKGTFNDVFNAVFDPKAFESEGNVINNHIRLLRAYFENPSDFKPAQEGLINSDFVGRVQKYASQVYNDKSWMKVFGIGALALVGVTLLLQPFFGNIKKDFPENKEGGLKK